MGVWENQREDRQMATKSMLLPGTEEQFCSGVNPPPLISPDVVREFYTAHYQHVLHICRRFFRQKEDAEDAAAEVFLKLYRVLHQKDQTLPFRPWLAQVAGHHCIDRLRQKKREKSSSLEEIDVSGFADRSTPSPLSQLLSKDDERRIREQLARLPEKYKKALVLRYYERMSYSEIARALNTRLPTVRIMLFRAKRYLRRNLRMSEKVPNSWAVVKVN
jgi:RNA polymerase sigma-70 factor, ECF subfamily